MILNTCSVILARVIITNSYTVYGRLFVTCAWILTVLLHNLEWVYSYIDIIDTLIFIELVAAMTLHFKSYLHFHLLPFKRSISNCQLVGNGTQSHFSYRVATVSFKTGRKCAHSIYYWLHLSCKLKTVHVSVQSVPANVITYGTRVREMWRFETRTGYAYCMGTRAISQRMYRSSERGRSR